MLKESAILKAIGESLREGGNCPYDPACQYGRGRFCLASTDVLAEKIKGIMESINKPGQFAFQITENASKWGCENIGVVRFVDPEQ